MPFINLFYVKILLSMNTQIYLARFYQADAILLMLSVLNDEQYRALSAVAHQLNMGVLTEVSTEEERQRAIELKKQK